MKKVKYCTNHTVLILLKNYRRHKNAPIFGRADYCETWQRSKLHQNPSGNKNTSEEYVLAAYTKYSFDKKYSLMKLQVREFFSFFMLIISVCSGLFVIFRKKTRILRSSPLLNKLKIRVFLPFFKKRPELSDSYLCSTGLKLGSFCHFSEKDPNFPVLASARPAQN